MEGKSPDPRDDDRAGYGQAASAAKLANTDGLTGLLNKRYFDRVLTVLEQHSQPFALFYMDLDRFKPVNDTYGMMWVMSC